MISWQWLNLKAEVNMSRTLTVPRGVAGKPPLELEMSLIDDAESRLHEVRLSSSATSKDLEGLFNEAANMVTKYLAWVKYELLRAEKEHELNRATVILDKAPEEAKRLKDAGIKLNEDIREALIARDEDCQKSLDVLNSLKAVEALLLASSQTFIRAHYSARSVASAKETAPTPNLGYSVGDLTEKEQPNFMGKSNWK
jgi:hypothetical protein